MPELGMSVLPGSVVASHLQASAAALADGTAASRADVCVGTAGELATVLEQMLAAQRFISATLDQLAAYVRHRRLDDALSEVLGASAEAAGHTADALAESRPLLHGVLDVIGEDTRL
jgi:ABC-type transporter Mla subunit MlaD